MAKDQQGNGLAYRETQGSVAIYDLWIANTVAFVVQVNQADPSLRIKVRKNDESPIINTIAHAVIDEANGHVDGLSIQSFVYQAITFIVLALYVTTDGNPIVATPEQLIDLPPKPDDIQQN